jgi:hypothetical protein
MARLLSILFLVLAVGLASPVSAQTTSTHDWLFPTGETVPAGDVHFTGHQLYMYDSVAWGVNDRLELSFSAPAVPMFVHAHARVALTERSSPWKLVGGIGAIQLVDPDDGDGETFWVLSGTAAYQGEKLNLHATVSAIKDRDEVAGFGVITAGARLRISDSMAFIVDWARVSARFDDFSMIHTVTAGMKHSSRSFDFDFGFVFVPGEGVPPLPLVSATHKF